MLLIAHKKPMENMQIRYSCINDHGETCCLSAGAVNKRSYADKDSPPPLIDLLRYISNPNHVFFQCYFRVQWNRELNNEWRPPQYPHIVETFCDTHCWGSSWMLWGGSEGLTGLWRAVKWGFHCLEGLHRTTTSNTQTNTFIYQARNKAFCEAVESLECVKSSFKQFTWF